MKNRKSSVIHTSSGDGQASITLRIPNTKHADAFVNLRSASDLLATGFFGKFNAVTQSMAAFKAVRNYLRMYHPKDYRTTILVVGDATPAIAAMFCFRTQWQGIAIHTASPISHGGVNSLQIWPMFPESAEVTSTIGIIVAVGPKANIVEASQALVNGVDMWACVSVGEITPSGGKPADIEYEDWGLWSPDRTVRIWYPHTKPPKYEAQLKKGKKSLTTGPPPPTGFFTDEPAQYIPTHYQGLNSSTYTVSTQF